MASPMPGRTTPLPRRRGIGVFVDLGLKRAEDLSYLAHRARIRELQFPGAVVVEHEEAAAERTPACRRHDDLGHTEFLRFCGMQRPGAARAARWRSRADRPRSVETCWMARTMFDSAGWMTLSMSNFHRRAPPPAARGRGRPHATPRDRLFPHRQFRPHAAPDLCASLVGTSPPRP